MLIISFVISLLGLPFILAKYRKILGKYVKILHVKIASYNSKERVTLVTSISCLALAGILGYLAYAQFMNSVPTLIDIQKLPASTIPPAFQDLMWFGVVSAIICAILGTWLFKVNWKELRIVLASNSFRRI